MALPQIIDALLKMHSKELKNSNQNQGPGMGYGGPGDTVPAQQGPATMGNFGGSIGDLLQSLVQGQQTETQGGARMPNAGSSPNAALGFSSPNVTQSGYDSPNSNTSSFMTDSQPPLSKPNPNASEVLTPDQVSNLKNIIAGNNVDPHQREIAKAILDTSASDARRAQADQYINQANALPHAKVMSQPNIWSMLLAAAPAALTGNSRYLGPLIQGYQQGQQGELARQEQLRNQQVATLLGQAKSVEGDANRMHSEELAKFNQDSQNYRANLTDKRLTDNAFNTTQFKADKELNDLLGKQIEDTMKQHKDFVVQNGREMTTEEQKQFADQHIRSVVNGFNELWLQKHPDQPNHFKPEDYVDQIMATARMTPGQITAKQGNADRRFNFQINKEDWSRDFKTKTQAEKKAEFEKVFSRQVDQFEKTYGRLMTADEKLNAYRDAELGMRQQGLDIQRANSEVKVSPEQKNAQSDFDKAWEAYNKAYIAANTFFGKDDNETKRIRAEVNAQLKILGPQKDGALARLNKVKGASNAGKADSPQGAIKVFGDQFKQALGGRYEQYGNGSIPTSLHPSGRALDLYPGKRTPQDFQKAVQYAQDNKVPYIIYNRQQYKLQGDGTYSVSAYHGPDPHVDHVHIDWKGGAPSMVANSGPSPELQAKWRANVDSMIADANKPTRSKPTTKVATSKSPYKAPSGNGFKF